MTDTPLSLTRPERRRNRGLPPKPAPISFTALQKQMHEQSTAASAPTKTRGAFGGITRVQRQIRDKDKAPKDLLPVNSPLA